MRVSARPLFIFCLLSTVAFTPKVFAVSLPTEAAVTQQTRLFLDSYARADQGAVLPQLADDIAVYGSDLDEVARGKPAVKELLAQDAHLWGGTARIGPMEHVSIVLSKNLATIFFDAPFSVAGRPPLPIRFAMVWQRSSDKWLLRQSSNVVPTQGQSAAKLLGPAAPSPSPAQEK